MAHFFARLAVTAFAATFFFGSAQAETMSAMRGAAASVKAAFVSTERPTLAPFAMVRFCMKNPADCMKNPADGVVPDDQSSRLVLQRVNAQVNSSIRGQYDKIQGRPADVWQIGAPTGDCEDYALTKRRVLTSEGFPAAALRIAIAYTPSGEGHAVLIVKTDSGDVVLDNRTNVIKPWRSADLRWVKIQSGTNPLLWYTM